MSTLNITQNLLLKIVPWSTGWLSDDMADNKLFCLLMALEWYIFKRQKREKNLHTLNDRAQGDMRIRVDERLLRRIAQSRRCIDLLAAGDVMI